MILIGESFASMRSHASGISDSIYFVKGTVLALVKVVLFGVIVRFPRFSLGNCKNSCVIFPHSGHSNV
jgi:hypothetical protein